MKQINLKRLREYTFHIYLIFSQHPFCYTYIKYAGIFFITFWYWCKMASGINFLELCVGLAKYVWLFCLKEPTIKFNSIPGS